MATAHVDTHSATSAAATVTVTAPDGIQNGHLLLGLCHARKAVGTPTITLPTNFTEIVNSQFSTTNHDFRVGWKLASAESGNYQFAGADATTMEAVVAAFSGGEIVTPVDTSSNVEYHTLDGLLRAATVTTSYSGALFHVSYGNVTTEGRTVISPTGYSQEAGGFAGQMGTTWHMLTLCYKLGIAAGTTTGTVDATISDSDVNANKHAFLIALKDMQTRMWWSA